MLKKLQTPETINALITRGLAIEADEALRRWRASPSCRALHDAWRSLSPFERSGRSQRIPTAKRRFHALKLVMAPSKIGLPYGHHPAAAAGVG